MELKIPITSTKITTNFAESPLMMLITTIFIIIITLQLLVIPSNSQQQYVNNDQLDCYINNTDIKGFVCNGTRSSCTAYITFRSDPPTYATPRSIATLLNSSASAITKLNNHISDVDPIPAGGLVVVPVHCACTGTGPTTMSRRTGPKYYNHEATYRLKTEEENYFTIANDTYQGLTTCVAARAQNPYDFDDLSAGEEVYIPIMCACPTEEQVRKYGARYLVSYLVGWEDDINQIADIFGADLQSVIDANDLKDDDDVIYPFTPILVPLKAAPTNITHPVPPPLTAPVPKSHLNPTTPMGDGGDSSKKWVFVGIGIAVGVLITSLSFSVWFFLIRPSRKPGSTTNSEAKIDKKDPEENTMDGFEVAIGSLTAYKFKELQNATKNFSKANMIRGSVFKGIFQGDVAAIKILKGNVPIDEINLLNNINHSNIIQLSGYCIYKGNTFLVYEYAEKGSLDTWLFGKQGESLSAPALGWKQRVQIACNIADALNYLHGCIHPPHIYSNLKSSNVLIDASYRAKITNFGLARTLHNGDANGQGHITKHVLGTHGYLAPEYIEHGAVTPKLDVFAFGVIILELLSGKPAVNPSGMNPGSADDLLFVVIRNVFEGENSREKLIGFMDSNLAMEYPLDLAYSMAKLAHKCVDQDMNSRPSIAEASVILSKIYSSSGFESY